MQLTKVLTSVVFISLLLAGSAALFRAPAYAQEFPSFGSPGSGALPHLAIELLKLHTKLDTRHIPYKNKTP